MNEEKLINLVQKNPVLYNKNTASYRVPLERQKAWSRISAQMGAPVDDCSKMWTSLREKYLRHKKRYKFQSGKGALPPNDAWPLFNTMRFLEPFIAPRTRRSENFVPSPVDSPALPATKSIHRPQRHTRNSFPLTRCPPSLSKFSPPSPFCPPLRPLSPTPILISPSAAPSSPASMPLSPSPIPRSPSTVSDDSPTPSDSSTISSRKRQCEEEAILEAVKFYGAECNKRKDSANAAIYGFGDMIVNTVINFKCPKKQAVAIQRLTNLAMEIQLENCSNAAPRQFKSE